MRLKYSQHLETLIALITNLSMTHWLKRTPTNLSKALSIDSKEIANVLDSYKGLFRKSLATSKKTGDHYYSLQLRYARQWLDNSKAEDELGDEDEKKPPLDSADLTTLLNFVAKKASDETSRSTSFFIAGLTSIVSVIVAIVAILSR